MGVLSAKSVKVTAMRWLDTIPLHVPVDPGTEPVFFPKCPGPKKEMTKSDNTILAIGVLYNDDADVPAMDVYNNLFAKIKLSKSDLAQVCEIRHSKMADDLNGWEPL